MFVVIIKHCLYLKLLHIALYKCHSFLISNKTMNLKRIDVKPFYYQNKITINLLKYILKRALEGYLFIIPQHIVKQ